jgi:glycosyltransferase involved in cell wall biosynthesis
MAISESSIPGVRGSLHARRSVLITVPRLDLPGGVANYYRVVRRHFRSGTGPEKEFFEVGFKPRAGLLKRLFSDYWRFHRRLSQGDVCLVHVNPSMNRKAVTRDWVFLLIARLHSVRTVVLFHGWDNKFRKQVQRWHFAWLFSWILNRAEGIVVLAAEFRTQLRDLGITVPISLGTTCVDDSVFEHRADHSDARLKILYLSRLIPGKGLELAIETFQRLDNATLTIAGDGPSRAAQVKLVDALGIRNVNFIGHVEGREKQRAYTEANVFFFPTLLDEGMPTTVLEAMAYGLPVVTRSAGGLKDFFTERMGRMTESRSDCLLAEMLRDLTPEVRKEIGDYNRRYAREHFSASRVAHDLESLYEAAASEVAVRAVTT